MPDPGPSMPQYRLRGLLVGTALVAAFCAVFGPLFRGWSFEERIIVLRTFGMTLSGFCGTLVLLRYQRWKSECAAGTCLWRDPRGLLWSVGFFANILLLAMMVMIQIIWEFNELTNDAHLQALGVQPSRFSLMNGIIAFQGLYYGGISAAPVTVLWSGFRLCQNGIVESSRWIPWNAIQRYHWRTDGKKLMLVLQLRHARLELRFPAVQHQKKADALLSEFIGKREPSAGG